MKKPLKREFFNLGSCPFCGSTRVHVRETRRPYRYCKCKFCKNTWKTLEVIVSEKDWLVKVICFLAPNMKIDLSRVNKQRDMGQNSAFVLKLLLDVGRAMFGDKSPF